MTICNINLARARRGVRACRIQPRTWQASGRESLLALHFTMKVIVPTGTHRRRPAELQPKFGGNIHVHSCAHGQWDIGIKVAAATGDPAARWHSLHLRKAIVPVPAAASYRNQFRIGSPRPVTALCSSWPK